MTTLDNIILQERAVTNLHHRGTKLGDVYYDPLHEAAFGTLKKLNRVAKKTGVAKPGEVKPWLEQNTYTLHHPVRKRFPKNPYSVDIMDVGECDLVDVQALNRHNDGENIC